MAEFCGCDSQTLNGLAFIEKVMREAAAAAGATVVQSSFYKFGPHGVSGVLVLAESHLSVHTWPERGYAATDIYTCGDKCSPERAHEVLQVAFRAHSCEVMLVERGLSGPDGMRLVRHDILAASPEANEELVHKQPVQAPLGPGA
ncbi:MAG: adenosylmethionine decarboxylase [Myxococcales bacterium]|nr:adenosylmethionine decarboxylase [Myxococcales bacterium]